MILLIGLWTFLRAALCGSAAIALENTALRHQLAVLSVIRLGGRYGLYRALPVEPRAHGQRQRLCGEESPKALALQTFWVKVFVPPVELSRIPKPSF